MLGPLPHSFSDSTGQRALRLGSGPPMPSPQPDIAPGMLCRRVSVGGGGGGREPAGGSSGEAPGQTGCPQEGQGPAVGCGLAAGMGLGVSLHGISLLWHLQYAVASGVACGQHPLHGCCLNPWECCCLFLLAGEPEAQGTGVWQQPGLAQLRVGHGTQHRMVAFQAAICMWGCHWGGVRLYVGALGRRGREHVGTCGGCSCLGEWGVIVGRSNLGRGGLATRVPAWVGARGHM